MGSGGAGIHCRIPCRQVKWGRLSAAPVGSLFFRTANAEVNVICVGKTVCRLMKNCLCPRQKRCGFLSSSSLLEKQIAQRSTDEHPLDIDFGILEECLHQNPSSCRIKAAASCAPLPVEGVKIFCRHRGIPFIHLVKSQVGVSPRLVRAREGQRTPSGTREIPHAQGRRIWQDFSNCVCRPVKCLHQSGSAPIQAAFRVPQWEDTSALGI